jgi:hypothetical protein
MQTMDIRGLERYRRLHLNIRRSLSQGEGTRRSSSKGRSAEFSGYREYIPGDDMRYVDWNAYARLDKLYIKEFMEEREGRVNIYLDTSRSMEFGEKLKSTLMAELTEIISFIAISGRDAVYVTNLADISRTIKVQPGKNGMVMLDRWLRDQKPSNRINIGESLKKAHRTRGGMTFIMSDFMDEDFASVETDVLKYFRFFGTEVMLVHILSKEELEIDMNGAYRFVDSEDESKNVRLSLDRRTIGEYNEALSNYIKLLKVNAAKAGASYVLCNTNENMETIVYEKLKMVFGI